MVTCTDCVGNADRVYLCPIHAAAESTAKQRDQLLETNKELRESAKEMANELYIQAEKLPPSHYLRVKSMYQRGFAATQPEQQEASLKARQKLTANIEAQASQLAYERQQGEEERSYQED